MVELAVHECGCEVCQSRQEHSDCERHQHRNVVLRRLDEQQWRWVVALESKRLGHGGDARMSAVVVERPATADQEQHLCLDKGYDNPTGHAAVATHGYVPHIRRIGEDATARRHRKSKPRRWVVECTLSWLSKCRALYASQLKTALDRPPKSLRLRSLGVPNRAVISWDAYYSSAMTRTGSIISDSFSLPVPCCGIAGLIDSAQVERLLR